MDISGRRIITAAESSSTDKRLLMRLAEKNAFILSSNKRVFPRIALIAGTGKNSPGYRSTSSLLKQ